MTLHIHIAGAADLALIPPLFTLSVRRGAAADYTPEERAAWAPEPPDTEHWRRVMTENQVLTAWAEGVLIGFSSFKGNYFDHLYVHPDYLRRGVATRLADETEALIRFGGAQSIRVDASRTARPFFEKRGYWVLQEQQVERRGQILVNYAMETAR